jgi:diguanylate cyclase (GGDEF)-like protein
VSSARPAVAGVAGAAAGFVARRRPGRLRRRVAVAEAVAELSHQALTAEKPDDLLRQSLQVAVDVIGAEYGTALRRLPNGELRVAQELGPEPMQPGDVLPLAREKSYVLTVVETGKPLASEDLRHDARITPPVPLLERGVVSGLAVPVRGAEDVLGVLAVHSRRRRRFNRHDVAVVSALAGVVATAWEQALHRERLGHQALHDPLTGLANRVLFFDRLRHVLARRPAPDSGDVAGAAVMFIDLDDFKGVNDSFGHAAGDELLRISAHRMAQAVRPEDTIARLGGDEFAVLCDAIADETAAIEIADRIQGACGQPVELGGSPLPVSASVGVTVSHPAETGADDAATLLGEADAALYRAKAKGRGRVQLFDDRLEWSTRLRRRMEAELQAALEREEFRLHYQPIRRSCDLRVVGVEALVRWQHPTRGLIPPGDFLPTAEHAGLLVPIGAWVLRAACRDVAGWQRDLGRTGDPLWLAVNVSPRQLNDPGLPGDVAAAQRDAALASGSLVLELTESALMSGDAHGEALTRLHDTGARLFLDDFGTGYSSLTHLTDLPIQAVKIDRSFVSGVTEKGRSAAVVSALIALSEELDLQVIAEGVERPDQLEALRRMHCQAVQGFLLDVPSVAPSLAAPTRP